MTEKNYGLIESVEQLTRFVDKLISDGKTVAIDIETGYDGPAKEGASLHPEDPVSKVVGISFTNDTRWARYVPLGHDLGNNLNNHLCAELFWRLLNTVPIIAHNAKFERRFLRTWFLKWLPDDVSVQQQDGYFPVYSDTMIEAYIAQVSNGYGLKHLTNLRFGHEQADLLSLFPNLPKNKAKTLRFNSLTLEPHVVSYACEDAVWCLALHELFHSKVKDRFIFKIEMEVLDIVCRMEDFGVKYDWPAMQRACREAEVFLEKFDAEIQRTLSEMAGKPILINLNSAQQLREVLFDTLGMKSAKKTETGLDSTGAIAMEALSKKYPVVRKILDLKEIKTLITKFLDKYPKTYAYAPDGMAHPNLLQASVISGRFACSDPNYMQSPKEFVADIPEKGPTKVTHYYSLDSGAYFHINFREFIVAPDDYYVLGFDYSQIELRVLAGEAQEPYLINAFENGIDIHKAAASLMFHLSMEDVTKQYRDKAKTLQFALLYQMGVKSLADRLAISKEEAQKLYDQYFASFSSVAAWIERVTGEAIKTGYSQSRLGRVHRIWDFLSSDSWIYSRGERLAVNAPIQGTAADICKTAMVRADKALKKAGLADRVKLVMNIHDALEFYVHRSLNPRDVIAVLHPAVVFPLPNYPRIEADWHYGSSWGTLKEIPVDVDGNIDPEWEFVLPAQSRVVPKAEAPPVGGSAPTPAVIQPLAAPAAVIAPPTVRAASAEPDKTLVVAINAMPTRESFKRFKDIMESCTGDNVILLKTPQGDLRLDKYRVGLTPKDQQRIAAVLGGATVGWDSESVDDEELVAGLAL